MTNPTSTQRGRPKTRTEPRTAIVLRLEPVLLEAVDFERGPISRNEWIADAVQRSVNDATEN